MAVRLRRMSRRDQLPGGHLPALRRDMKLGRFRPSGIEPEYKEDVRRGTYGTGGIKGGIDR